MTPKIDEKTITFDADDMQKKASLPLCFSIVLGVKTGGAVPKTRLQQDALQKTHYPAIPYQTLQCNAMQRNAMQFNAT